MSGVLTQDSPESVPLFRGVETIVPQLVELVPQGVHKLLDILLLNLLQPGHLLCGERVKTSSLGMCTFWDVGMASGDLVEVADGGGGVAWVLRQEVELLPHVQLQPLVQAAGRQSQDWTWERPRLSSFSQASMTVLMFLVLCSSSFFTTPLTAVR